MEVEYADVYWVCAYANRQQKDAIDSESTADPKDSSLFKAMQLCEACSWSSTKMQFGAQPLRARLADVVELYP